MTEVPSPGEVPCASADSLIWGTETAHVPTWEYQLEPVRARVERLRRDRVLGVLHRRRRGRGRREGAALGGRPHERDVRMREESEPGADHPLDERP